MILAWLLLLTGLTISSVAIYYSVFGLTAIFSAAAIPIMIMGVSLEVAKLVCATWIKQYWTQVPRLMKTYMVTAVVLLMLITSMGIFGFLSKAHNDQNLVSGDVQSKIAIYDEKIKTARDNIDANRKALKQMDEAVDQVMGRSTDEKGADKAVAIRNSQKRDRASLAKDIEANQKIISQLNDEAAPIRAENRKVEAEVGPIKYIAAFIYGVAPDASMLEKAVTWIIIMIVVVFDPLAVIMLLASQMTFGWIRNGGVTPPEQNESAEEPNLVTRLKKRFRRDGTPTFEGIKDPVTGEWIQTGPAFEVVEPPEEYTDIDEVNRRLEAAKTIPESNYIVVEDADDEEAEEFPFRGRGQQPGMPLTASYQQPHVDKEVETENDLDEPEIVNLADEDNSYLDEFLEDLGDEPAAPAPIAPAPFSGKMYTFASDPVTGRPMLDQPLSVKELTEEEFLEFQTKMTAMEATPEPEVEQYVPPINPEAAPGRNRGVMNPLLAEADNAETLGKASNASFGNQFPENPQRGDLYLRTDYLPNRLYKFNDTAWLEVDKNQTDVYAYDEMYIKHLIEQIDLGTYDIDALTDLEREQIKEYLGRNAQ